MPINLCYYKISPNKMTKKYQSRAQDLRNKEYRDFIRAIKDGDEAEIDKGVKKGFYLGNKVFIDLIEKEIYQILNRQYVNVRTYVLIRLLNPDNINDSENGLTVLDNVIDLFSVAIDSEDDPSAKKYFINNFLYHLDKLLLLGAKMNQPPRLPENQEFIEKLQNKLDSYEVNF
jgi:hypothetical protein